MLKVGDHAPSFRLTAIDGSVHALDARSTPLTLAIFFKTSCPTCHYAWEYYERLHRLYGASGLRVLGISQHNDEKTRAYRDEHNATFPHLLDSEFEVSRAYDPAIVPTGFLVSPSGEILDSFESWNSEALNAFSQRVAETLDVATQRVVTPEEDAVETKIG
jgi:peroxiredoxin